MYDYNEVQEILDEKVSKVEMGEKKQIFWDNSKVLDPRYLCKECGNEFNPNVRDILGLKEN